MKHFFPLLLFVTSTALGQARLQAPAPTDDPHVFDLTQNVNLMSVTYKTPQAVAVQVAQQQKNSYLTATQRAAVAAQGAAEGGILTITWARPTAVQAAAKNFSLIILDAKGQELQRAKLTAVMAEPLDIGGGQLYPQSTTVPLTHRLTAGTKVFVIEAPVSKRYEFLLQP